MTRDTLQDENEEVEKNLEFNLYLPDILGAEVDQVETHVSEPMEPVDVRKNRQLTLDNMKLHREIEKLKSQASKSEALKKELRSTKAKLEEEHKVRMKTERELAEHNKKVKTIAQNMDTVEKEFQSRDKIIQTLEKDLEQYKSLVAELQGEVKDNNKVMNTLQTDLERNRESKVLLLQQYKEAEVESRELQEFLQAEKMTLAETLKDYESEIAVLRGKLLEQDIKVGNGEDKCSQLVSLNEQKDQEILTLEAQLTGFQDKARDMLLAQGAEISRATILISELYTNLERVLSDNAFETNSSDEASNPDSSFTHGDDLINHIESAIPRSNSQFLVPTNGNEEVEENSSGKQENTNGEQKSSEDDENNQAFSSSVDDLSSSLEDRIGQVKTLVDKIVRQRNKYVFVIMNFNF